MRFGFLVVLFYAVFAAIPASAHDARPNYVQITETGANTYSVSWKVPASMPGRTLPYPTLPGGCVAERQPAWQQAGAEYVGQQLFVCDQGLSGRVVGIEFPILNPSLSTLYKIKLANGEEHLRILKPDETEWTVPDAESRLATDSTGKPTTYCMPTSTATVTKTWCGRTTAPTSASCSGTATARSARSDAMSWATARTATWRSSTSTETRSPTSRSRETPTAR